MKKILFIIILLLLPINVWAVVNPSDRFYINDYADILSSDTEDYIFNKSVELEKVDGTQIVVVTVKNLEGMDLEEYANRLFRKFGIGDEEKDNGLLLLLALEERQFRVEVGDGFGEILPDGKTGRFQDEYIIPYLKDDKWDEGIRNGYDAFYSEIVKLNNLDLEYTEPVNKQGEGLIYETAFYIIVFIGIICGVCNNLQNGSEKKKFTIFYMIGWSVGLVAVAINIAELIFALFVNLFFFFVFSFYSGGTTGGIGGGFRSGSSGGFSRGGFSGGGGFSSGGGSSRGF